MKVAETSANRRSFHKVPSAVFALMLGASLLFLSVRGVHWGSVTQTIARAEVAVLLVAMTLASCSLFLRTVRWRVLLRAAGTVGLADAFWATAVGYLGNNVLPARAGELLRTQMIATSARLPAAFVLTTAVGERIADGVVLAALCVGTVAFSPSLAHWAGDAVWMLSVGGLAGLVVIVAVPILGRPVARWMARNDGEPVREGGHFWLDEVIRGAEVLRDPRRFATFTGLTLGIWAVDATSTIVGAHALGLRIGYPAALVLLAGLGLGSAVPSTPGYVGVYQFVAVQVLVPSGFTRSEALAYIFVAQASSYVVIALWAAGGMLRHHIRHHAARR